MKLLIFLLFLFLGFQSLFAQAEEAPDSCLHFEDYNFCYNVNYRPKSEKVGTICTMSDFMLKKGLEVVSYDAYLSCEGELKPARKAKWSTLVNLVSSHLDKEFSLVIEIKARLGDEVIRYPVVEISNCK